MPREDYVEDLVVLDPKFVLRLYTHRRDALSRFQEHGMPRVIIEKQEQLVAEARIALERMGLL